MPTFTNKMRLTNIAFHRNGVGGRPFYAIAFRFQQKRAWRSMIATVFESDDMEPGEVHPSTGLLAVLDADLAARGIVEFGDGPKQNGWRGDVFEPQLRQWIARYEFEMAALIAASLDEAPDKASVA